MKLSEVYRQRGNIDSKYEALVDDILMTLWSCESDVQDNRARLMAMIKEIDQLSTEKYNLTRMIMIMESNIVVEEYSASMFDLRLRIDNLKLQVRMFDEMRHEVGEGREDRIRTVSPDVIRKICDKYNEQIRAIEDKLTEKSFMVEVSSGAEADTKVDEPVVQHVVEAQTEVPTEAEEFEAYKAALEDVSGILTLGQEHDVSDEIVGVMHPIEEGDPPPLVNDTVYAQRRAEYEKAMQAQQQSVQTPVVEAPVSQPVPVKPAQVQAQAAPQEPAADSFLARLKALQPDYKPPTPKQQQPQQMQMPIAPQEVEADSIEALQAQLLAQQNQQQLEQFQQAHQPSGVDDVTLPQSLGADVTTIINLARNYQKMPRSVDPSCPISTSDMRSMVDAIYAHTRRHQVVMEFLDLNGKGDIHPNVVRNYLDREHESNSQYIPNVAHPTGGGQFGRM